MNINIISIGKIREQYIKDGIDEFLKRLRPYSSIKLTEIPSENLKNDSDGDRAKKVEAEKILNFIKQGTFVIAMDVEGKALDSEKFAKKISEINLDGYNQIAFVIGGALGIDNSVLDRADFRLSLSKMTFPHQIARFLLLEQVYRAFRIINNEPYHK